MAWEGRVPLGLVCCSCRPCLLARGRSLLLACSATSSPTCLTAHSKLRERVCTHHHTTLTLPDPLPHPTHHHTCTPSPTHQYPPSHTVTPTHHTHTSSLPHNPTRSLTVTDCWCICRHFSAPALCELIEALEQVSKDSEDSTRTAGVIS